jgi:uncharacterized protein
VLPMFAGIYRVGAGLGPAAAFLYAGPAINVLAIFLTARVLGFELGVARLVGTMVFGVVIGILMAVIFRRSEEQRTQTTLALPDPPASRRPLWQNALLLAAMLTFLVFSDWFNPGDKDVELADGTRFAATLQYETEGAYDVRLKESVHGHAALEVVRFAKAEVAAIDDVDTWVTRIHYRRWYLAGAMGLAVVAMSITWLSKQDFAEWMGNTWEFSKMLVPLLFGGVFAIGFLGALVPEKQVATWVGDNSLWSNLVSSVIGCLMYFATLTEVPILETLMRSGMATGPALALLLAGPALSLPSILVIRSILGNVKTAVFVGLVVLMSAVAGWGYGMVYPENPFTAARPTIATVVTGDTAIPMSGEIQR